MEALEQAKAIASEGASGRVATFVCDVSKADEIEKTFAAVVSTFGKVDILVNNAGISRAMPSEKITDELWQEDLDLKLFAADRLSRLVWPGMKERKWGRIINVLNTGAKAPRANGAPTAVSRAAGMALMKVLAGEVRRMASWYDRVLQPASVDQLEQWSVRTQYIWPLLDVPILLRQIRILAVDDQLDELKTRTAVYDRTITKLITAGMNSMCRKMALPLAGMNVRCGLYSGSLLGRPSNAVRTLLVNSLVDSLGWRLMNCLAA